MIKILIAEDSEVVALLLKSILEKEADFKIIGHAKNGRQAVEMAHELKPDLITMDIRMPVMDGFEATRMIMSTNPVPIVVVSSSVDSEELQITFRAIEEGALAVVEKPGGFEHPDFDTIRTELVDTLRGMAEVKLVRRISRAVRPKVDIPERAIIQHTKAFEIVAMGTSTGGPQILHYILSSLPIEFPLSIVIAQHISKGFISGLAAWLQGATPLEVKIAEDAEPFQPGTVYFAPDDHHLLVTRGKNGPQARLTQDLPVNGFRPSATSLLGSVAQTCAGHGVGALLTGMGTDGAQGLLEMRQARCHTFVQDETSAIVYGMPGAAIALDAVDRVIKLENIAAYLTSLARQRSHPRRKDLPYRKTRRNGS